MIVAIITVVCLLLMSQLARFDHNISRYGDITKAAQTLSFLYLIIHIVYNAGIINSKKTHIHDHSIS